MPILQSTYRAPWWLPGGHLQTIYPALTRRMPLITTDRERIETEDGDLLQLDWKRSGNTERLVILSHGLEGSSADTYMQGMAAAFVRAGWDVLAWNCRGCGGAESRKLRSYHSGSTDDLAAVVNHALSAKYERVGLIGFSLGGNITLKYLGDLGKAVDRRVKGGVAFSVPCDLAASSLRLERFSNRIYMSRFMRSLRTKIRGKMAQFPGELSDEGLETMRTFREFDGAYTAPLNGFESAEDYWARASSKPVLGGITVPTLLVNARNDPFLPGECFPEEEAKESKHFYLEAPDGGGHLGFLSKRGGYWSEQRAVEFLGGLQNSYEGTKLRKL